MSDISITLTVFALGLSSGAIMREVIASWRADRRARPRSSASLRRRRAA